MRDRDLYARILGVTDPWQVVDVELDVAAGEVRVRVETKAAAPLTCPQCGQPAGRYDCKERTWRHLDTCQYQTWLVAQVPRVRCAEHGVHQVLVPWAEPGSRFTALMEAVVIDWLRTVVSIQAVAKQLRLSWDEVDTIVQHAVRRGLGRRKAIPVRHLGVDETSFQKHHEYVTLVTDAARSRVLHVADDRSQSSLDAFFQQLSPRQRAALESVSMDMWAPYIRSTFAHVPGAEHKIAFDKFHVVSHLTKAVDQVRRDEHRELSRRGDPTLKGSRYAWLGNPERLRPTLANALEVLRNMKLRTVRAWHLKETAQDLWHYVRKGWARQAWLAWTRWALRSRLEPMKQVARMIRDHLWGIVNAMHLKVTNAVAESMNAQVKRIKQAACGFRNRERFRHAILFHLGGLDLYPAGASGTHTKA